MRATNQSGPWLALAIVAVLVCCGLGGWFAWRLVPPSGGAGSGASALPDELLHLPSKQAVAAFEALSDGVKFEDRAGGAFGGGTCVFIRTPETTRPDRRAQLHYVASDSGTWYFAGPFFHHGTRLDLRTDGDAADLYFRITGKKHPTLKGDLSAEYRAFLEGKR